jgi:hypothetical protein
MQEPIGGKYIDLTSPRGYYLDYSALADAAGSHDEAGLPVTGRRSGHVIYSPSVLARYALGNLELYLGSGSSGRRARFEAAARWMIDHAEEIPGGHCGWPMPEVPAPYRRELPSGWFSGSAHAECVSCLVRASLLIGLDEALDTAGRAMGGFSSTVDDGGFLRETGEGGQEGGLESLAFFEEFPMPGRTSMALDGHIRALWAIFDYSKATAEAAGSGGLFARGAEALAFVLERYDIGFWSSCDLDQRWRGTRLAGEGELRLHAFQLELLARMSGLGLFRDVAARWNEYAESSAARRKARWLRLWFRLLNPGSRGLTAHS